MEEIEGNFVVNTFEGEVKLEKPETRTLYHKPDTNLYYLQTHIFDQKLTLDDVCFTCQMTFSCKVENIFLVMKTLVKDSMHLIDSLRSYEEKNIDTLNSVETTVNHLIESYNNKETEPIFKIIMKKENAKIIKKIVGYLQLIILKLSYYYNRYLHKPKTERTYLKDTLTFNLRHHNYVLYEELKKNLKLLFLPQLTQMYNNDEIQMNNAIANIIQKIIVQPEILERDFIKEGVKVRKNVFKPTNIIERNTYMYGDPSISLISYHIYY
jgi:hypothetical protein